MLHKLIDSMPSGVIAADAKGKIVLSNPAALHLLGADPQRLPPDRWGEEMGLHDEDGSPCRPSESPLHRALRGEPLTGVEMLVRARNIVQGTWLSVNGAPLSEDGGGIAVFSDVSARHEAQLFLEAVVENIPDMIFVKDANELRFVRFNRAGEELLGYKRADLIGRNDYDFFTREEADFFTDKDRAVLAGKKLLEIPEEPIHTRELGVRTLHTKKIPILDRDGTPRYLLGISEDITDRKRAEQELAASQARQAREQAAREAAEEAVSIRDDFLSIASHELRGPVTALQFAVQSILRLARKGSLSEQPPHVVLDAVETAERQVRRLAVLIEMLLDVSRIHAGRLRIARTSVDLAQVARDVVRHVREDARRAGSAVNLHAPNPVVGHWDPARLEQLLTNLVDNAIKYGAGKPVDIDVALTGVTARVTVSDQGIGIPAERQPLIFDRFVRVSSAEHFGGLGLGLFIVKRILDALGGTIRVESASQKGTKFTVDLPLGGEETEAEEES